jgi:S-layer protein (TIGR01567 family)
MKKVTAITLTAFVVLLASAMAVSAVDMVEIRGPVETVEDGAVYKWGPQEFAGFYYDIDDNIGQESITLTITVDALEEPNGVVYETVAQQDTFDFDEWGDFWTIGFFAEEYFAAYVEGDAEAAYLFDDSTDTNLMVDEQLSKVLYDDDEERTFTTGTPLKLEEDYELAIEAIDLDGNKVYVQLMKDGSVVDSAVVEPSKDGATIKDKTYTYKKDLGDTEKIVVIAVHFKNAFRGADTDLATVDGIWQISDTITDVEEDTEYDQMTIQTVNADTKTIMMNNEDNKITLNKNKDQLLMENIRIKTADQDTISPEEPLRFYLYKEITEPGTYEIRGTVKEVVDGATAEWDVSSFAGFYYDIDDDLGTEKITMTITGDALEEPEGVVYTTEAQQNDFDFEEWGKYWTIGFLAEEYFAAYVEDGAEAYLAEDSTDDNLMVDEQLSKVLFDDDEERTFTTGTPLKLEEDYELAIQAIDLDGNKVYVQLMKDGAVVDSAVVEPSKDGADIADKTYTYTRDLGDTEDIVVIAVHFKNAFRGADQDLATVDGIWQISDTITDVEEDTEYDKMTVQSVNADTKTIMMNNEDNKITLNKNKDQLLMENIRIKTADQDDIGPEEPLRFYIYEEATIEAEEEEEAAPAAVKAPEPVAAEVPAVEEPVAAEEPAVEEPAAEEPAAEEPAAEEPAAEEEAGGIPGFEAVFAITGLLAVSYLVLRKRE